ncbi:MAG: acylneuraminate cytidylyltransferase [Fusobacteria bacterium]|nr:acylneuraminate cytidylyltransferase [Fusobacteriota bacterium]
MKIGVIIQARATSTRLKGKIFKKLPYNSDVTVLEQVIRRVKRVNIVNEIIIATTINNEDDFIEIIAKKENVKIFRGSELNVLERFYLAATEHSLNVVVRITADCPCIDFEVIEDIIMNHINLENDYTSNTLIRSYPHGLDVEVFNYSVLKEAYENGRNNYEIEHVTPYIYKYNSHKFKIGNVLANNNVIMPNLRITLDTEEDYTLLCIIYDFLYKKNNYFNTIDIVNLVKKSDYLLNINKNIVQKQIFDSISEEYAFAIEILKKQDLFRMILFLEECWNDR